MMKAWIANTDFEWFRFLSARPEIDEINFWRPSGGAFKVLAPGEPLLFRRKAPHNAIAGVGFFVITNGLLLRSDLHTLFDRGYLTITPKYHLEVSRRIREEYENGRDYYALSGRELRLPTIESALPDPALLDWHNRHRFLG